MKPSERRESAGRHARFKSYKRGDGEIAGLATDHPAVVEGRTLFPGNVRATMETPRLLISGKNNPKTGATVEKGAWAGFPIYTLTLEERATCPKSCANWHTCYGNGMQWPTRHDGRDPNFIPKLAAEVFALACLHPKGFVVRLHVLGDFFSVRYVLAWAHLLSLFPNLHVYGYTARRLNDPDRHTRHIAAALKVLTDAMWSRFAIRTSDTEYGPQRAFVIEHKEDHHPDAILCPAQTDKTACCATCGLCWAPALKDTTIEFERHGRVKKGAPA